MKAQDQRGATLLDLVRQGRFLLFTVVQSISQLGDRLDHLALIALLADRAQHSPLAFSELAVYFTLPNILFAPVSGVVVDRLPRKWILVAGDLSRAVLVALIPLVVWANFPLRAVFFMVFLIFFMGIFYSAARMSVIPDLLPSERYYLQANSMMNILGRLATVAGMVVAGYVIDWKGWESFHVEGWAVGFWMDSLTYLIAGLTILFLPLRHAALSVDRHLLRELSEKERHFFRILYQDLRELVHLLRQDPVIRWTLASVFLLVVVAGSVYTLVVVQVQQVLGYGTRGIGLLGGVGAVGMVSGALFFSHYGHRWSRKSSLFFSLGVLGLLLVAFSFPASFRVILLYGLLGGAFLTVVMITQDTVLHETVPESFRGRVFSLRDMLLAGGFLLTSLLVAPPGEYFGVMPTLRTVGVLVAILSWGIWPLLRTRRA